MDVLPTNEYTEVEGRYYANPQIGLDESSRFIDNLRATQGRQNQEIVTDTQMLGTDVPSNIGGLTGAEGYFTSRYQTPQTNSVVANLRATAQAAALNQILANQQEIWKKRYNDAYRAYQKRNWNMANTPTTAIDPYKNPEGEDPDYETTTPVGSAQISVDGVSGAYTVVDANGNLHIVDMNTRDEEVISPGQNSKTASSAVNGGEMRTLPNGNTVLVKPGYSLSKDNGKYYLVNRSTGVRTEVGGY